MHPVFLDLSRFELFGIGFNSPMSKLIGMVIAVALAMGVSFLWDARAKATYGRQWYKDPLRWLCVAGWLVVGFLAVWIVGRIFSYGLMVAMGFGLATVYAAKRFRQLNIDVAVLNSLVLVSLICGIIGARITFIIYNWDYFTAAVVDGQYRPMLGRLVDMLKISQGGLVFDGGLTLGVVAVLWYLWYKKLPVRRILDVLAVALMIGLSLGRVGCFLNGCCYGGVCDANWALGVEFPYSGTPILAPGADDNPWPLDARLSAVYAQQIERSPDLKIPPELLKPTGDGAMTMKMPAELSDPHEIDVARHAHSLAVHPVQLYSSVNAMILAILLHLIWRRRPADGVVMSLMLTFYGITRFILEIIRDDNPDMTITVAQYKCMAMVAAGLIGWAVMARAGRNADKTQLQ